MNSGPIEAFHSTTKYTINTINSSESIQKRNLFKKLSIIFIIILLALISFLVFLFLYMLKNNEEYSNKQAELLTSTYNSSSK